MGTFRNHLKYSKHYTLMTSRVLQSELPIPPLVYQVGLRVWDLERLRKQSTRRRGNARTAAVREVWGLRVLWGGLWGWDCVGSGVWDAVGVAWKFGAGGAGEP